ncbi:metallophosphoesterase [Listeria floridensis FSL S10-1187]|uniref:Metallophosphoesterase n=1 Tax=Listeria floridensis FSL S10-1187 TaxID=1265817 RepID=A0ABP3AX53_9LIST|nr:metallophosphoesterase [Listeria floridensis]EUJ25981.1 metallophosphoesterase [Listeria floridensis FSL S10-1187]
MDSSGLITERPPSENQFILLGDFIDKGENTAEMIEFLFLNQTHFYFILGNHESFVYNYLQGKIKNADAEIVSKFFDSIPKLQADSVLHQKFNQLVELSAPFYRVISKKQASFYATHAPCKAKYLGKLDHKSLRKMRNFHLDRSKPTEEQLLFLQNEANSQYPYHFFGHVAAQNSFRIQNKVHLDTGCVYGNLLSKAELSADGKLKVSSIPSNHPDPYQTELPVLFV